MSYVMLEGFPEESANEINFGGAFGENTNEEKKHNATLCSPHHLL